MSLITGVERHVALSGERNYVGPHLIVVGGPNRGNLQLRVSFCRNIFSLIAPRGIVVHVENDPESSVLPPQDELGYPPAGLLAQVSTGAAVQPDLANFKKTNLASRKKYVLICFLCSYDNVGVVLRRIRDLVSLRPLLPPLLLLRQRHFQD